MPNPIVKAQRQIGHVMLVVHCPFHEEETPSCVINPITERFHCFGCKADGKAIGQSEHGTYELVEVSPINGD